MMIPKTYEESEELARKSLNPDTRWWLDANIDDSLNHGYVNKEAYEKILIEVLKDKPKRVIDIGSNINQYAYIFTNQGIQYIGIDIDTLMAPITYEGCVFIASKYEDIRDWFKDDVIISNLCVGYLVKKEDVICKKLILGQDVMKIRGNDLSTK